MMAIERAFAARTKLKLRDVLGQLGPRMSAYVLPDPMPHGGGMLDFWFHIPRGVLVAEVRDMDAFRKTLDQLVTVANEEFDRLGGVFLPPAGQREIPPGTDRAEFRKLPGNVPGYVLADSAGRLADARRISGRRSCSASRTSPSPSRRRWPA